MKRFFILLITLCLVLSWGHLPAMAEEGRLEGDPWINSNLYGCWPAERPGPEEQFELYANFDFYRAALENSDNADSGPDIRVNKQILESMMALCTDPSRTDAESECLRILFGFQTDQGSTENDGFASLMTYVDRVKNVKTIDELTALMQEEGALFAFPFFYCNLNPYSYDDGRRYTLNINRSSVIDRIHLTDEELEADTFDMPPKDTEDALRKLERMGFSREEASGLVEKIVWFEDEYQNEYLEDPMADIPNVDPPMSAEQISTLCPPLYTILKGQGLLKEDSETDPVYYVYPDELCSFRNIYTEENLELLKAVIALTLYNSAIPYLGSAAFPEAEDKIISGPLAQLDYYCRPLLFQAYWHNYIPMERIEQSQQLFEEIKGAMRARIEQSSWASAQTKENAIKKINQLVLVSFTYRWEIDFEPLRIGLRSCSSLMEAAAQCALFNNKCTMSYVGQEAVRGDRYFENFNLLSADGQYEPQKNSYSVGYGILSDGVYDGTSRETLLATLGATLAHETSHGFDQFGMYYDADGNQNPVCVGADMDLYMERANALAERAGKIKLLDDLNVMGSQQLCEIIADMQGVRLILDLAAKEENFDYDLFFRSFTQYFRCYHNDRTAYSEQYSRSLHPSPYVRVNFTLQAMDEFYDTYPSAVEGTPMYLPSEERIFVW